MANNQAPFDRPRLRVEREGPGLPLVAAGGAIGLAPRIVGESIASVGDGSFRVGVEQVRGGEMAYLGFGAHLAAPGTQVGGIPFAVDLFDPTFAYVAMPTEGVGTGGYATAVFPLPADPGLRGLRVYAQWLVTDAFSPVGAASSAAAEVFIY